MWWPSPPLYSSNPRLMVATCRWSLEYSWALYVLWRVCSPSYWRLKKDSGGGNRWDSGTVIVMHSILYQLPNLQTFRKAGWYTSVQQCTGRGWQMRNWDANCQYCPHSFPASGKSFHIASYEYGGGLICQFPRFKPLPKQDIFNEWHFPRGVNRQYVDFLSPLQAEEINKLQVP